MPSLETIFAYGKEMRFYDGRPPPANAILSKYPIHPLGIMSTFSMHDSESRGFCCTVKSRCAGMARKTLHCIQCATSGFLATGAGRQITLIKNRIEELVSREGAADHCRAISNDWRRHVSNSLVDSLEAFGGVSRPRPGRSARKLSGHSADAAIWIAFYVCAAFSIELAHAPSRTLLVPEGPPTT